MKTKNLHDFERKPPRGWLYWIRLSMLGFGLGTLLFLIFVVLVLDSSPKQIRTTSKAPKTIQSSSQLAQNSQSFSNIVPSTTSTNILPHSSISDVTSSIPSVSSETTSISNSEDENEAIKDANAYAEQVAQPLVSSAKEAGNDVQFNKTP